MKILIVDDDDNIRTIAQMALEGDGVEVLEANSGLSALEVVKDQVPDLILLDMMMPDMDGKTACTKMKEMPALSGTAIIFLTAKVQSHEINTYGEYGAAGVISKPFDPMTLSEEIDRILKAPA